jgi:hypothetical protein
LIDENVCRYESGEWQQYATTKEKRMGLTRFLKNFKGPVNVEERITSFNQSYLGISLLGRTNVVRRSL